MMGSRPHFLGAAAPQPAGQLRPGAPQRFLPPARRALPLRCSLRNATPRPRIPPFLTHLFSFK
ncbi:MAG TPA: hypothetical protein VGO47_10960 [Chlamydiales bacterium]|nr:hypothetical protein [Chlamydiales bacterium]